MFQNILCPQEITFFIRSGKISLRNLRRVARELGENMTDEELRSMIDEFDTSGTGESKL